MKEKLKRILQLILGIKRYEYLLGIYKVYASKKNEFEIDFPFFISLLKENYNVLDIGANVGYTTVLISKKVKNGKVFSFEPVPYNFEALKRITKKFRLSNVFLFNCALADYVGTTLMSIPVIKSVLNTNSSHIIDDYHKPEVNSIKFETKMVSLDSLDELKSLKVDAVKIDVEGFENIVFNGGKILFKRNRPIVYSELHGEENREKSIKFFTNLGYSVKVYEQNELVDYNHLIHNTQNYFFIPL